MVSLSTIIQVKQEQNHKQNVHLKLDVFSEGGFGLCSHQMEVQHASDIIELYMVDLVGKRSLKPPVKKASMASFPHAP